MMEVRKITLRYNKERDELGLLLQDREVMEHLLALQSRAAISKALNMPLGSVNESCSRIYKTLECHSVAELIIKYKNQIQTEEEI